MNCDGKIWCDDDVDYEYHGHQIIGIVPTNLVNMYRVTLDSALLRILISLNTDGLILASWT
jgi:hypothetical protein